MESEDVSWRDILYSVLEGMNPWDIDLVELATRYSIRVDEMAELNFRLPANVILVCSVLLRMKAEILTPPEKEFEDYSVSLNFIFNSDYPISALINTDIEPYPISIKPSRQITRKVSAVDLIDAIQAALSEKTNKLEKIAVKRGENALKMVVTEPEDVILERQINIMEIIEETYSKILNMLTSREEALFSDMAQTREEVLHVFLSILHLSNTQRISLRQDKLFDEIYIRPV